MKVNKVTDTTKMNWKQKPIMGQIVIDYMYCVM
jgi:hypothetical protein